MKSAIITAGAAILLMLISMESGAQGNPPSPSAPMIAGRDSEDKGVLLPLLRQRRQAGECKSDSDCPSSAPCCSHWGFCGAQAPWCWETWSGGGVGKKERRRIQKKNLKNTHTIYFYDTIRANKRSPDLKWRLNGIVPYKILLNIRNISRIFIFHICPLVVNWEIS